MPVLRKLLVGAGLTAVGAVGYVLSKPKPAPFHVAYPPLKIKVPGCENAFPFFHFLMSSIPESARKKLVVKMGAPKPNELQDRYDCLGESPYTIKELVSGRMWRIGYDVGLSIFASKEGKEMSKAFGLDPSDPSYLERTLAGAAQFGEKAMDIAKQDVKKSIEVFSKESYTGEELMTLAQWRLNTFVVKLNSGSLLLYAPVKVREETGFAEWLDGLGKVEWIIIASAAHTLNIQSVVERYPEAKVVGPPSAEAKLNHISALPRGKVDYNSTDSGDLAVVNELLVPEGVKLFDVAGDVCTNALLAVYDDKQLMSCDLIYTHADGEGFLLVDRNRFWQFSPADWFDRLFRYNTMAKPHSPNGYLPAYRYQLMDPNCLGVMNYTQPAFDGSSCRNMAESLRNLLTVEFEYANGVHFDEMSREEYVNAMDKNWNWLDGKSLL